MTDILEIQKAISLLEQYPQCVAWLDFSDRGNPCCGKYQDDTTTAINLGVVKSLIPKYSSTHTSLNKSIVNVLGGNWVTYDWLIKVVSRVVSVSSFSDFKQMIELSIKVKNAMAKKSLTEIKSVAEAFA